MKIVKIEDALAKEEIIVKCDSAFKKGVLERKDGKEIIQKIVSYADFFCVYMPKIAGYAAIYANDLEHRVAYISMIGVCTEYQNMHIGSCLINACIDLAKERKMKAIRLEVDKENEKAIEFYKKNNFKYESRCSEHSMYMILEF